MVSVEPVYVYTDINSRVNVEEIIRFKWGLKSPNVCN